MTIKWDKFASKHLIGRTIVEAKWLSAKECKRLMGWDYQPLELFLVNGTILTPSADDEGNNAGALFTNIEEKYKKKDGTIGRGKIQFPVFREYY